VSLLPFVGAAGGDDADILAPFRERDMIQTSFPWTEQMESTFPVISPCVFLDKSLWVRKAREDIKEVDAMPSHIALPLGFIPFLHRILLYVQIVCTCQGLSQACLALYEGQERRSSCPFLPDGHVDGRYVTTP
jgi:hypothetical protein